MDKQFFEKLRKLRDCKTVIVGIGNILKGDDGAGPLVCRQLQQAGVSAELIDAGCVPENYIQPIIEKAPQTLLIIDAVDFGAPAGTISIFKPDQLNSLVISTHTLSPGLFVDMIRQEIEVAPVRNSTNGRRTPGRAISNGVDVYFIGIQPAQTQLGQSISPAVTRAARQLSHALAEIFPSGK